MHAIACMNAENSTLNKNSQIQKAPYYNIPFITNVQNRQIHRDRKVNVCARSWEGLLMGIVSFWGNKNILESDRLHNFGNMLKTLKCTL